MEHCISTILLLGGARGGFLRMVVIVMTIFFVTSLRAQHTLGPIPIESIGLRIGYSFVDEKLSDGRRYHPWLMMVQIGIPLGKGRWGLVVEPQYNIVQMGRNEPLEHEVGATLAIRYRLPLGEHDFLTASISSGPKWITAETGKQARGFLFSDNFTLGYSHITRTDLSYHLDVRFRHLSNAGLQLPNAGLDNWFLIGGVGKVFR